MSAGWEVTVTYRVEGAETLAEAREAIGVCHAAPENQPHIWTAFGAPKNVTITIVTAMKYNVRSIKEEHRP